MRNPFDRRGHKASRYTPDGLPITEFPPAITHTLRLYGGVGSYAAMYKSQPNVRTVVDFLARNIAQLPVHPYESVGGRLVRLDDHPMSILMRRPNPRITRYLTWFGTIADLAIYDRAYWWKLRRGGRVVAVQRVPYPLVNIDRDPRTAAIIQYRFPNGDPIDPDDMVVFHGYDPDLVDGHTPPLQTLRRLLAEEWAAGLYREGFWKKAARREGVIERPLDAPKWDDPAFERFRESWNAAMSGTDGSGATGILEEGMRWRESSFSPREAEYITARKLSREEVASAFHIPPTAIGILDHGSYNNAFEGRKQVYQDTLPPWLVRCAEELDLQLLSEFEAFDTGARMGMAFNIDEKLVGSFTEEADLLSSATGGPWMTLNEGRARKGLPPLPGGDDIMTPLNSVRGGGPQPSPQTPIEVPEAEPKTPPAPGTKADDPPDDTGPVAPPSVLRRRDAAAAEYEALFRRTFDRQKRAVTAMAGATKALRTASGSTKTVVDMDVVWDTDRWNRELSLDLQTLAIKTAGDAGRRAMTQLDADPSQYDETATLSFIETTSRIAAENINRQTRERVEDALTAAKTRKADEPTPVDDAFAGSEERSAALGATVATSTINFGRHEAASQVGNTTKTWVVVASNSRHPEMNGEVVPVDSEFSNGMRWPGQAGEPPKETSGCQCLMIVNAVPAV